MCHLVARGIYIRWQYLILSVIYIVQLYKEDSGILRMLGCRAVALPSTEQIVTTFLSAQLPSYCLTLFLTLVNANISLNTTFTTIVIFGQISTGTMDLLFFFLQISQWNEMITHPVKTGKYLQCPLCQERHEVPKEGVEGFRKNFYVSSLKSAASISSFKGR